MDEFLAKILTEYNGKKFKSVSEADFTSSKEEQDELMQRDEKAMFGGE